MRFFHSIAPYLLLACAGTAQAASWSFDEATISVNSRGAAFKEKLAASGPLGKVVPLGASDTVKITLRAREDGKAKRPHQAFLLLHDQDTRLETTFPLLVKDDGKGKVDFTQKDIPVQLLTSSKPLQATLLLASFGASKGFSNHVFNIEIKLDATTPSPRYDKPLRYEKLGEINHIFKADPKSGPKIVSLFFVFAVLASLPILLGMWAYLGANLSHLGKATAAAPISHTLFFSSVLAMESIFFFYYYSWNLFQTIPAAGVVGVVAFLSGSKALSEVQSRRVSNER
ncbi:Oligosaccharyltransferase subunit Ribophorin II-domain-containing protein [Bisporella sp. PMI_857]|nr:Oligosaccharyltransferase subunit Ribophorin II-domain-containing protein [Bisporella sp. PMI_857]